jgi:hypothetical protein
MGYLWMNRRNVWKLLVGALLLGCAPLASYGVAMQLSGRLHTSAVLDFAMSMWWAGPLISLLQATQWLCREIWAGGLVMSLGRYKTAQFRLAGALLGLVAIVSIFLGVQTSGNLQSGELRRLVLLSLAVMCLGIDICFLFGRIELRQAGILRSGMMIGMIKWDQVVSYLWDDSSPDPLQLRIRLPRVHSARTALISLPVDRSLQTGRAVAYYLPGKKKYPPEFRAVAGVGADD